MSLKLNNSIYHSYFGTLIRDTLEISLKMLSDDGIAPKEIEFINLWCSRELETQEIIDLLAIFIKIRFDGRGEMKHPL